MPLSCMSGAILYSIKFLPAQVLGVMLMFGGLILQGATFVLSYSGAFTFFVISLFCGFPRIIV